MKKTAWGVIIFLVLILFIWGINRNQKTTSTEPIKIGVATLLSGDYALLGENIRDTATLAVDQINKSGGINGRQIVLDIQDSKLDSKSGLSAVEALINNGDKYVIAGMSSNGTLAAAPVANDKQVILMVPVTGGSDIDNAGEYVFRVANSDNLAGVDIADGMNKLGFKNVAVVTEVTDYDLNFRDSFKNEVSKIGLNLVLDEQFQPGTTDFRTLALKVKNAKPEATLVLSQTGLAGAYFIKQSKDLGVKTTIFSDFNLVTNTDAKKIAGTFDGIYFTDPAYDENNPKLKEFFGEYMSTYGHQPSIPFHTAATYDSIQMLVSAIKNVGDNSSKVHDWLLSNIKNYNGFMGTYSLDAKGNSDLGFIIKKVQGDSFVEVK